ncbi:MAG: cellulose biosynthesis cyclic di-GMP-binding regulatory protein BcsB [Elainellaceae cyanobacterium]
MLRRSFLWLRFFIAERVSGRERSRTLKRRLLLISLACLCIIMLWHSVTAQTASAQQEETVEQQEERLIQRYSLPQSPQAPVYQPPPARPRPRPSPPSTPTPPVRQAQPSPPASPPPEEPQPDTNAAESTAESTAAPVPDSASSATPGTSQYVLEFNRSPVVGNRFRLKGIFDQARLGFSRPRDWELQTLTAIVRYQHSPALMGDRSFLTLRVNDTNVGSVPLNRPESRIGEAIYEIPLNLVQDYNELSFTVAQYTAEDCTNPADPRLWTEVLPDSRLVFSYRPKPISLTLDRYPYPFIDALSFDPSSIAYAQPEAYSEAGMTSIAQIQASLGRITGFRGLTYRLIDDVEQLEWGDRLIVIGTPGTQPMLSRDDIPLSLPLVDGLFVDGNGDALPNDVGILMLSSIQSGAVPVLIVSGNGADGVSRASQALIQPGDRQILTGQVALVSEVSNPQTPDPREWPGYLPTEDNFQLQDLTLSNGESFRDVTVRGTEAPLISIPFRALPSDRFFRGNTMTLNYTHSPQVNPRTSEVEVLLDGVVIASKRLGGWAGGNRAKTYTLDIPANLIEPDTVLGVQFVLNPRESDICGPEADQQLWGTLNGDTRFHLNREAVTQLPDLRLLQTGFPFTAPQDLSETVLVVPDQPGEQDIEMMLAIAQRLGQTSQAEAIRLQVYRAGNLPGELRTTKHLIGIGRGDQFPLGDLIPAERLQIDQSWLRQMGDRQVQTLPDNAGVLQEVVLPQSSDRALLALTAQTDGGMDDLRSLLNRNDLFSQIRGDTILVQRQVPQPSAYDPSDYLVKSLQQAPPETVGRARPLSQVTLFLQQYWYLLPTGLVLLALLLYGISQVYLNRVQPSEDSH